MTKIPYPNNNNNVKNPLRQAQVNLSPSNNNNSSDMPIKQNSNPKLPLLDLNAQIHDKDQDYELVFPIVDDDYYRNKEKKEKEKKKLEKEQKKQEKIDSKNNSPGCSPRERRDMKEFFSEVLYVKIH